MIMGNALPEILEAPKDRPAITVLTVGISQEDYIFLVWIFRHSNWRLRRAYTGSEAMRFLHGHRVGVVLAPGDLPDAVWDDLLDRLRGLFAPPVLVAINSETDPDTWARALHHGAYDVLCRPFNHGEVVQVISSAWLHWKEQTDRGLRVDGLRLLKKNELRR
jgi:DNA-binding response OmpR family regulator